MSFRQPVIDVTGNLLEQADAALQVAAAGAGTAVALAGEAQTLVDETKATLQASVDEASERKNAMVTDAQDAFTERFGLQLNATMATIETVAESVRAAQALASSISRIPGIDVEPPGGGAVNEIVQKVQEIEAAAQEARDKVERVTAMPGEAIDATNTSLSELSQKIGQIESSLANIEDEVAATQESLNTMQENYARTNNLAVIVLCLILAWSIFSQVIVIRWAWSLMHQSEEA